MYTEAKKRSEINNLWFGFSVKIAKFCRSLDETGLIPNEITLSLFRSGVPIGMPHDKPMSDHRMDVEKVYYWLRLLNELEDKETVLEDKETASTLIDDLDDLVENFQKHEHNEMKF